MKQSNKTLVLGLVIGAVAATMYHRSQATGNGR